MHIYSGMTKIISLSDDAYERLKRMKGKDSFSKAVLRLTESKLSDSAGAWKDYDELDEIFKEILEERHTVLER